MMTMMMKTNAGQIKLFCFHKTQTSVLLAMLVIQCRSRNYEKEQAALHCAHLVIKVPDFHCF